MDVFLLLCGFLGFGIAADYFDVWLEAMIWKAYDFALKHGLMDYAFEKGLL